MNLSDSKLYVSPMVANDLGLEFGDKKNRNANWTDHEVISFLEILQEDEVLKDLSANRNKQVGLDSVYTVVPKPGGPGGPLAFPIFGGSDNPISTGEGRLSSPITTSSNR